MGSGKECFFSLPIILPCGRSPGLLFHHKEGKFQDLGQKLDMGNPVQRLYPGGGIYLKSWEYLGKKLCKALRCHVIQVESNRIKLAFCQCDLICTHTLLRFNHLSVLPIDLVISRSLDNKLESISNCHCSQIQIFYNYEQSIVNAAGNYDIKLEQSK